MRIRRFTGTGIRETMETIRAAVGPKAVILSTQKLPDGTIEIVTAVEHPREDLPESVRIAAAAALASTRADLARGAGAARPQPAGSTLPAALRPQRIRQPDLPAAADRAAELAPAPVAAASALRERAADPGPMAPAVAGIHQDLQALRRTLEFYLSGLQRDAAARRSPHDAALADALRALRVADDVVDTLLAQEAARSGVPGAGGADTDPYRLLVRGLALDTRAPEDAAGKLALVGPPGAGKTTTIAKLAALAATRAGADQVAIVTDGSCHVGGSARLEVYARLLGVPVYSFATPAAFPELMAALAGYRLVLVDGAGFEPGERAFGDYLELLRGCAGLEVLLTLPATVSEPALEMAVRAYATLQPAGCVLTKLDAAPSLGDALSVVLRHRLRCVWATDGQRVPADIQRLDAADVVRRLEQSADAAWRYARATVPASELANLPIPGRLQ